jgi:hypothetical protein
MPFAAKRTFELWLKAFGCIIMTQTNLNAFVVNGRKAIKTILLY